MVGLPAIVVEINDSGLTVQSSSGSSSTVTVVASTVVVSSHTVNGSSSFSHVRVKKDRVTDHHEQHGHQTCEQDVLRGLHGLCHPSDEVRNS